MPNGVYKSKAFDDDDLINHRTFVDPPTNDKTTEEPEKSDLEKLKPVPFHQLVRISALSYFIDWYEYQLFSG